MLGIDPDYFLYDMSMEAYSMALQAYNEKIKDEWERTRKIAFYAVAPYLKNDPTIEQFMPFEWDNESKKTDSEPSSKERFDGLKVTLNLN